MEKMPNVMDCSKEHYIEIWSRIQWPLQWWYPESKKDAIGVWRVKFKNN